MKNTLLCLAATLAVGGAHAATTWTMTAEQPDANYLTQNVRQFADDVKAATQGALQINVTSNSTLLKRPEVKRGVQQGVVQIGEVLVSAMGNEDPLFEIDRSEEHTSELQSLMRISYAVFCLKQKKTIKVR